MHHHELDMTHGRIWPVLLAFTGPLLLENLLQLLYNTADSIVVGRYVGISALAAVSATTQICGMLVRFFNGTATGAGVVISQSFGAKDTKRLHDAIQTTMLLTLIACAVLTAVGVMSSRWLLEKISTPPDVFDEADLYLKIYFGGISGLLIYNMGGAVLRAMGDTKRPLMFLIFCSLLNIILDLVFVIVFHWGIAGVATATILAQAISAVLVLYAVASSTGALKNMRMNGFLASKILQIGLPFGFQMAIVAFSNVFIQGYINYFGTAYIAGWGVYSKLDQYMILPIQNMGQAVTTFAGQNIGAGDYSRARRGTYTALAMIMGISICVGLILYTYAPELSSLFSPDASVIAYGAMFIRLCAPFAVFCCFTQIFSGALRGDGNSQMPMILTLCAYVLFRQVYLYFITRIIPDNVYVVGFAYPAGWIVCAVLNTAYYFYWQYKVKR